MAVSMPIRAAVKSPLLNGQPNGAVDPKLLDTVDDHTELRMLLIHSFAINMRALHFAARVEAGLHLDSTGRNRPLAEQWSAFNNRYEPCTYAQYLVAKVSGKAKMWPAADRAKVAARLGHGIPNATYWRKKKQPNGTYPATAAVPGTSDHGDASADDLALRGASINHPLPLTYAATQWLFANAPRFAIYWATKSENWHVNDCSGGSNPPEALRYLNVIAMPSLRIGATGPYVTWVQAQLKNKGAAIVPDGKFGPQTENNVKWFQGLWGQPQTGVVNADFWWMVGK